MSQNIEIEFKNLLKPEEFEKLLHFFSIKENDFFHQENHYFDTKDFALKNCGSALRIREKHGKFEMTLKQPAKEGLLETNQILSTEEASLAFSGGKLPGGLIQDLISNMHISFSNLAYFGSLKTKRAEIGYKNGLLVFDHSYYLKNEDFEIEYEVDSFLSGQKVFMELLEKHNIPLRKTDNKISRFYEKKQKRLD
ncbi:MAG: CYTH domain-containing protein [Bacillota bacterium]|nr:CYTH domain-containing protein [Bacillota bacterium]